MLHVYILFEFFFSFVNFSWLCVLNWYLKDIDRFRNKEKVIQKKPMTIVFLLNGKQWLFTTLTSNSTSCSQNWKTLRLIFWQYTDDIFYKIKVLVGILFWWWAGRGGVLVGFSTFESRLHNYRYLTLPKCLNFRFHVQI